MDREGCEGWDTMSVIIANDMRLVAMAYGFHVS
jgi:hypothetical protein